MIANAIKEEIKRLEDVRKELLKLNDAWKRAGHVGLLAAGARSGARLAAYFQWCMMNSSVSGSPPCRMR